MPIYADEATTREDLEKLRQTNQCKICGGWLNLFRDLTTGTIYLACNDYLRTQHNGIERVASRYEMEGLAALNIPKRRQIMEEQLGKETTTALEKARLPMTGALTQPQAMHILSLVYPNVPKDEIVRTAILCRDFGLHPLMKEVYIIPFGEGDKRTWVTVLGINATRKMMSRQGTYSYLDNTPRVMREKEQVDIFGKVDKANIVAITKLRTRQGEAAQGYGRWPYNKNPYGMDKGNTQENMAFIRSERNAFGRLFTDAMPQGIDVIDEAYVDLPDVGKIDTSTGEIVEGQFTEVETGPKEHWCEEHRCDYDLKRKGSSTWYAHELSKGVWCNELKKKEATKAEVAQQDIDELWQGEQQSNSRPEPMPEATGFIDIGWLEGALNELKAKNIKAGSESNLLGYMRITYKIEAETVLEGATLLGKNEAAHFAKAVQDILDMA